MWPFWCWHRYVIPVTPHDFRCHQVGSLLCGPFSCHPGVSLLRSEPHNTVRQSTWKSTATWGSSKHHRIGLHPGIQATLSTLVNTPVMEEMQMMSKLQQRTHHSSPLLLWHTQKYCFLLAYLNAFTVSCPSVYRLRAAPAKGMCFFRNSISSSTSPFYSQQEVEVNQSNWMVYFLA